METKAEKTYRWRKTIMSNIDSILAISKKSKKNDTSSLGQFDLFSENKIESRPEIIKCTDPINMMECVRLETELLGMSVLYDPIENYNMHEELFCTHECSDLFEITKNTKDIIIIDRVIEIEYKTSKKGNKYCVLYLSRLGIDVPIYLWGQEYKKFGSGVFIDKVYMFRLDYREATKDFSRASIVLTLLKSIENVDIESEYERIINLSEVSSIDEPWMIKNRKDES